MRSLIKVMIVMIVGILLLIGCNSETATDEVKDEKNIATDGELKIAIDAPPPTLDQPTSTASATRDTSRLIFETLVTLDANYQVKPMLAESVETDDNQTFTFHLREGVKFHNGEEMKADDVVASMYRWLEKSSVTGNIFEGATFEAADDYTVILELEQPSALTLDTMASAKQAAAIMPKEIIDEAPVEGITEYIGTGPFQFVEWKQDQYIHFERFDDYQPIGAEPDGLAGKKEALVKDIYVYLVPDSSTRITGLQTGEYDIAYGIPADHYEQLKDDPNIDTYVYTYGQSLLVYNNVEGISTDFKIRQAINMALDIEDVMSAAYIDEDLYALEHGYMDKSVETWSSDAGAEFYNQNDPEAAKALLEEAGYDGEEFVILTTRDYDSIYNATVVIHEQLTQLGMNAKLEVYDWPTLQERRDDPELWDAFFTSSAIVSTPSQLIALSPTWSGGVNDDHIDELMDAIETAQTEEEARKLWDELQEYAWGEHLPVTVLGSDGRIFGVSSKVKGFTTTTNGAVFWNTYVEE